MTVALRLLALAILLLAGAGCADTNSTNDSTHSASAIPWNRPEKWEGTGALGGMMNANGGAQ